MSGATKLITAGGGGVSLTPASSIASDVTVNVPSVNGTLVSTGSTAQVSQAMLAAGVAGNGPAFSAYTSSAQTIASSTWTKIQFQTEEFDTANCFDNVTNFRFTPTVAGYYQFNAAVRFTTNNAVSRISFYKNGSEFKTSSPPNSTEFYGNALSTLMYLNGSTDYVEVYEYANTGGGSNAIGLGPTDTWFQASLVRAA